MQAEAGYGPHPVAHSFVQRPDPIPRAASRVVPASILSRRATPRAPARSPDPLPAEVRLATTPDPAGPTAPHRTPSDSETAPRTPRAPGGRHETAWLRTVCRTQGDQEPVR